MWLVRATRSCSQSLVTKIWGAKRCGGHGRDARASKGGGFERIANVYGFERWLFQLNVFFVLHHWLSSIICGSLMLISPFPESNFLISVSSLYLLLGVPKNPLIDL